MAMTSGILNVNKIRFRSLLITCGAVSNYNGNWYTQFLVEGKNFLKVSLSCVLNSSVTVMYGKDGSRMLQIFFGEWLTYSAVLVSGVVASSFSRGSSWPRTWTSVSCVSCSSSHWATWEARVSFCCTRAYTHPLFSLIGHFGDWAEFLVLYTCCLVTVVSDSLSSPRTVAHQAPLSMGFPRPEHWSGLPFPSPGHLPGSGIEPMSRSLAGWFFFFTTGPPGKPVLYNRSLLVIYLGCYIKSMGSYCFFTWVLEFV